MEKYSYTHFEKDNMGNLLGRYVLTIRLDDSNDSCDRIWFEAIDSTNEKCPTELFNFCIVAGNTEHRALIRFMEIAKGILDRAWYDRQQFNINLVSNK